VYTMVRLNIVKQSSGHDEKPPRHIGQGQTHDPASCVPVPYPWTTTTSCVSSVKNTKRLTMFVCYVYFPLYILFGCTFVHCIFVRHNICLFLKIPKIVVNINLSHFTNFGNTRHCTISYSTINDDIMSRVTTYALESGLWFH
jgi:hypothetical protein